MTKPITDLLRETSVELKEYWSHASEELETHTEDSLVQILEILGDFSLRTEKIADATDPKAEFDALVADAFQRLHALNEAQDNGLLETDEREMIAPFFDNVALTLGIDPGAYEHQDVTYAVRDF
ncbi:MAG: hypothetical protein AAGF55_08360 [Pseudomonadota bacterium]